MEILELGAGAPVVLLHGSPTPVDHMLPLARLLARAHRVLVPAFPGYGGTPSSPGDDVLERGNAALAAALREQGIARPILVGYSLGAYRALSLALGGEVRARGVVCLAGFATLDAEARGSKVELAAAIRAGADLRDAVPAIFMSPAMVASRPDLVEDVKRWIGAAAPSTLADELDAVARCPDLLGDLRALRAPLLGRVGALDLACPPRLTEDLVAAADGTLEVVPGVAHAILHEDLDGTASSILRFAASLPAAA